MKKRIIFIAIFTIFSALVTFGLIEINTNNVNDNQTETEIESNQNTANIKNKTSKNEKTVDVNGTYDLNDLKIIETSTEYKNTEMKYFQIDGLKDQKIEDEINTTLKEDVELKLEEIYSKTENPDIYVYGYANCNFSNVISLNYDISYYLDENKEDYGNISIHENFDLITGNKLKLNDIFSSNAPVNNIFSKELYYNMVRTVSELENAGGEYEDELAYKVKDYNDIEEEIFKLINKYENKQDIDFYFDETKVYIVDYGCAIYYEDYIDYITIYDKYITKNTIFDGTYSRLKNLQTLSKRYNSDYQVLEKSDNYYIDISLEYNDVENQGSKVIENVQKMIDDKIEEIKNEVKENSSEFIIINDFYSLDFGRDENMETDYNKICTSINTNKYITTPSEFNTKIYDKINKIFKNYKVYEGEPEAYLYGNLFMNYLFEYNEEENENYIGNIYEDENYIRDSEDIIFDLDGNILETKTF